MTCALEQDYGEELAGGCGRHRERGLPKSRRQERVLYAFFWSFFYAAHVHPFALTFMHAVLERRPVLDGPRSL